MQCCDPTIQRFNDPTKPSAAAWKALSWARHGIHRPLFTVILLDRFQAAETYIVIPCYYYNSHYCHLLYVLCISIIISVILIVNILCFHESYVCIYICIYLHLCIYIYCIYIYILCIYIDIDTVYIHIYTLYWKIKNSFVVQVYFAQDRQHHFQSWWHRAAS